MKMVFIVFSFIITSFFALIGFIPSYICNGFRDTNRAFVLFYNLMYLRISFNYEIGVIREEVKKQLLYDTSVSDDDLCQAILDEFKRKALIFKEERMKKVEEISDELNSLFKKHQNKK